MSRTSATSFWRGDRLWIAATGLLCLLAYIPILNNGFIADDFVFLSRVEILKTDPGYLLTIPPEFFRSTSDLVIVILKQLFGYRYGFYYAFNIALHFLNCMLLRALLREFPRTESAANIAALSFAVFQAPQEAITWIICVSEQLQAFFVMATLMCWARRQHILSLVCYSIALLSKESAVMVLPLIPVVDYLKGVKPSIRRYSLFLIPTTAFVLAFLLTLSKNFLIGASYYGVGPHALLVLVRSMARLMWPWFFVLFVLLRIDQGRWPAPRWIVAGLVLLAIPFAPYIFLVYQDQLPSRQVYMASVMLISVSAVMLQLLKRPALRNAFLIVFVAFNIPYLWLKKDPQYEDRAAPTTQLLAEMRQRQPTTMFIRNFGYPKSPEIAYLTTELVPGWQREMILVEGWNTKCDHCVVLRWEPAMGRYMEEK